MNKQKFLMLDGLRGMAALLVLIRHSPGLWGSFNFYHSYLAVDLFFALSGFVIAHAYESKLLDQSMSFRGFSTTRIIRLYPMFLISLALVLPIHLFKVWTNTSLLGMHSAGILLTALLTAFFIPSNFGSTNSLFALNGPYWSLLFELIVNFLYGFFAKHMSARTLTAILVSSGLILTACGIGHHDLNVGYEFDLISIAAGLSRAVFGFTFGIVLYRKFQSAPSINTHPLLAWFFAILAISALLAPSFGNLDYIYDLLTIMLLFPVAIFIGAKYRERLTWEAKTLDELGALSYPIYVLHMPMIMGIGFIVKKFGTYLPTPVPALLLVTGTFLVARLLTYRIDIPLRRKLTARFFTAATKINPGQVARPVPRA